MSELTCSACFQVKSRPNPHCGWHPTKAASDDARELLEKTPGSRRPFEAIAVLTDALRKVLAHHVADSNTSWCLGCDYRWPCDTVRNITEALGGDP